MLIKLCKGDDAHPFPLQILAELYQIDGVLAIFLGKLALVAIFNAKS